jgi:hypothetical protein
MTIYIEKNLSFKTLDYLLLQNIAEMKLDRNLNNNNPTNKISFIQSYRDSTSDPLDIIRNFKVAVGATVSLDQSKVQANEQKYDNANFDGGAGTYTKLTESQADYFLNNYDILDYYGDDESGFSATVFKN